MLECVKIKAKVLSDYVALGTYGEALWHYTCVCVRVCSKRAKITLSGPLCACM